MPKYKIMIARFPYGGAEESKCVDYLIKLSGILKADARVGEVISMAVNDTPITMTRNKVCRAAQLSKCDYLVMVDNDMVPDYQATKPFWETSFDFALKHNGPCIVAAPYCGPPPHENVYVFQWQTIQSDQPEEHFLLKQFTREQASVMVGIQEVAALPTGLFLMDVRALDKVKKPWFYYEYSDEYEMEKSSTEDVTFTRDCSLAGVPIYCNWDAWAGHVKRKIVGKPHVLRVEEVANMVQTAVKRGIHRNEKHVGDIKELLQCNQSSLLTTPSKG